MGGNESRVEQHESPTDDSDDWKSRVEVKPSKQLVARLEQLQRNQDSTGVIETSTGSFAEPSPLAEDQRQQEDERGLAMQKDAEVHARGVRRAENDNRVRELRDATFAESALLSKKIGSVVVPKLSAERQSTFCIEESKAVIMCYQSQRSKGEELTCTDFVDMLEACTSNATRAP